MAKSPYGSVTQKEFWRTTVALTSVALVLLLVLFAVDLALAALSSLTGTHLDPAVWGTYAAWASAVLPMLGIIATFTVWINGRREERLSEAHAKASLVVLERGDDAVAAVANNSGVPIRVVAVAPPRTEFVPFGVGPGKRGLLYDDTAQLEFALGTGLFRLVASGECIRIPD